MNQRTFILWIVVVLAWGNQSYCHADDFESNVRPLLKRHCIQCHGPLKQAGGLRLDAKSFAMHGGESGPVIKPGQSPQSVLWQRISSHDDDVRMPPEGSPLSAADQALIQRWIDEGAQWIETDEDRTAAARDARRDHWAWQPLRDLPPPAVLNSSSTATTDRNPIDLFVNAKLDELGLSLSQPADRRTLIRRLYFDLLGLPPTPEEVLRFERDDREHAYEHLVDRLLNSPHYGERAAQHWLDIAHYADTHGFERDQIREHAWRYRDWVIQAFNQDLPYDEFLRRQIAGDALDSSDPNSVVATGFLSAGPWDFVGQAETPSPVLRRLARADDLDDMITQVMAATMGVTINCARCHDHKLDPISQREYYSISSLFAGVKRGNRPISTLAEQQVTNTKAAITQRLEDLKRQLRAITIQGWDLADIVGGGNGLGTGKAGSGIDPLTGQVIQNPRGFLEVTKVNNFVQSSLPVVDGVAIPDGQSSGELVISSTGLRASNIPHTSGKAWDAIRNGPVHSQFSTKLDNIEYNDGLHRLLSLHANALITIDLSELPQRDGLDPAPQARRLRGSNGYFGQIAKEGASVFVLLDGQIVYRREHVGRRDGLQSIDVPIPSEARFLTLMATDNGNDIGHDQICFVDLQVVSDNAIPPDVNVDDAKVAELKKEIDLASKQLAAVKEADQFYGVQSETPPKVALLIRGDTEQPGEVVQPGAISCLAGHKNFGLPESASDFQRRIQLARWITDDNNSLMSRVMVNRLWQQHFGVGLVSTPSDFGLGGGAPSHPELLDWLAVELKRHHYSLKAIHRLICCSAVYRQQSTWNAESRVHQLAVAKDSSNRWLWRQNARRLDAESMRDAVLTVSGQLNIDMFGPGFREFDYKEEYAPVYSYVTKDDAAARRRSIYRFRVRTTPNPWLTTLDCPNPANLTPTRNTTTTALQSLALLNHEFLLQQANRLAERLEKTEPDSGARASLAWRLAFGREALSDELQAAQVMIERHGLAAFARYLLNANEFITID